MIRDGEGKKRNLCEKRRGRDGRDEKDEKKYEKPPKGS